MVKIILVGAGGKMGRVITECVEKRDNCEIVAGVEIITDKQRLSIK